MPKYNEGQVAGEQWTRSFQIVGWNDYGRAPGIRYDEELAISLEDGKVITSKLNTSVSTTYSEENALEQFQLKNPLTEEYIDAYATYQDFFILVHSLYFHLAQKRDRGPSPYPSWVWNEEGKKWEAPTVKPDGDYWVWEESALSWVDTRPPKPFPSWTWDTQELVWKAPIPYPNDGLNYIWDEDNLEWDLSEG